MLRRLLFAVVLAVPLLAVAGTAQAAACTGSTGVTVVVQFPAGNTVTACAPGDPTSGSQALTSAGFTITYVNQQAFVCKINAQPSSASCARTPPADAYWAYFHARRGGSWSYSSTGATTYDPAPGSVEGWRFGSGSAPSTPPPAATVSPRPTHKPKPKPTGSVTPSSPAPTASITAPSSRSATVAAKKRHKLGSPASRASSASPVSPSPVSPSAVSASPASPSPVAVAPVTTTSAPSGQDGGTVSWWWGLVALAVVGGGAGAVTLARRS